MHYLLPLVHPVNSCEPVGGTLGIVATFSEFGQERPKHHATFSEFGHWALSGYISLSPILMSHPHSRRGCLGKEMPAGAPLLSRSLKGPEAHFHPPS